MKVRLKLAIAIVALTAAFAHAKKMPPAPTGPAHSVLDLRTAIFSCGNEGCALDVMSIGLIGCNTTGCKTITDILVPAGPVLRQGVYAPPAPAPAK